MLVRPTFILAYLFVHKLTFFFVQLIQSIFRFIELYYSHHYIQKKNNKIQTCHNVGDLLSRALTSEVNSSGSRTIKSILDTKYPEFGTVQSLEPIWVRHVH